jgi:outer membrane immunogenic protein
MLPYGRLTDLRQTNSDDGMGWVAMLRSKPTLISSAALLGGATMTALAADLPGPPPAYPPPQAPAAYVPAPPPFSWTGFYLGGNAGYGWSSGSGTLTTGFPNPVGTDTFSASGNGFVGGGQAGFNYQWSSVVIGLEADFQGSTGSGTLTGTGAAPITATAKDPWFGTVRGRLGYAWDRVLLYATGGGVYGNATASGTSGVTPFSSSATYVTWTAGAGVEAAFWGPWSAKVEYLYAGSPSSVPSVTGTSAISGKANSNIIRAGINYHF